MIIVCNSGTLFEGGTRGIGFVHSPLLKDTNYVSRSHFSQVNENLVVFCVICNLTPLDIIIPFDVQDNFD